MLNRLLKTLLFTILIPLSTFSQDGTVKTLDSICFDVETASKIMNDLIYLEGLSAQKSDSINSLMFENKTMQCSIIEQKEKIANKNTGLWIQGGINFVLGILTLIFSN